MTTLFISDLHLSAERPEIIALFERFLDERARRAAALYILGDLFEYWIGDEAVAQPEYRPVIEALKRCTEHGLPVFVMHGNRDFLLGAGFTRATGCRLLPDPTVIDLYDEKVLIMHGDTLCTDDVDYQRFRRMVRDPDWIAQFIAKPLAERIHMAQGMRETSKAATAAKRPEIMDVNPDAVEAVMRAHGVRHLIHGHTHRPARHALTLDGESARRTVLGDWYEQGSVLTCTPQQCMLERLD
jgi:UDP-2,3-diacylglucosamine hydrolase